jgi:predicted MPP superfamily phosphohydrolase
MAGPGLVLTLAWIAAILGPIVCAFLIRRLLRSRRIILAAIVGVVVAVPWGLGVWAFLVEPATLTVRHVTVESAQWRGPPLRIGIISDTHVAAPHTDVRRVERLVARMNAQRPDVVMLLGDYAGGHEPAAVRARPEQSEILRGVDAFRALASPLGVHGVLGNHDSWYDDAAIAASLRRAGVSVLDNQAERIARPGGAFWIAGLADMESPREGPDVAGTLGQVGDAAPVIVLTHWPDPFLDVPDRVALTLAGHTHCGQVNLPFFGRVVQASRMSKRWGCGLYEENGRKLFVTSGVGVSILPVRFRAPPEIVVLTLKQPAGTAESFTPDEPDLINALCVSNMNPVGFARQAELMGGRRLSTNLYQFPGDRSVSLTPRSPRRECVITFPGDQIVRLGSTAFQQRRGYDGWGGHHAWRRASACGGQGGWFLGLTDVVGTGACANATVRNEASGKITVVRVWDTETGG